MKNKIIWVIVLLIQLNFYLSWILIEDQMYIIKSYVIGSGISYGLLSVLILTNYNESKNIKNKILQQILIFISCSIIGIVLLGVFSIVIPFQILNLIVLFAGIVYTSMFVFKSDRPGFPE